MSKSVVEKLAERSSLALIVLGALMFIVGSVKHLSFGSYQLNIADWWGRAALWAVGLGLIVWGSHLLTREGVYSTGIAVEQLNSPQETFRYVLARTREAKMEVCDLTWTQPSGPKAPIVFSKEEREEYYRTIEEVSHRIRYREIVAFYGSKERIAKVHRLIERGGQYYEVVGFVGLLGNPVPLWNFVVIDNEVVLLKKRLVVREPKIVEYFRDYYEEVWSSGRPIKVGDVLDLGILEEAKSEAQKGSHE